jgi:serine-type D-Ala-D-Ala carboxypeptidase (penicillin-binding protein 5/6)
MNRATAERQISSPGRRARRPALTGAPAALLGGRARAAAAACLAVTLTAAAGMPRPGDVQHPSGPIGGPELAARGVIVNYPARHAKRVPKVDASAWVVADAGTGQVLAARDPHGWFLPASTLKVLTAITLMPVLNPDATVVTTKRAANQIPSRVGLIPGDKYKISDLFKAMLMISANDAAMSLAQATGSIRKGVAMMNAEAHHLQAYDTVAKRPNGLNGPGQHVSAYDEALFARQALAIPQFMHDIGLRTARFPLKPHHKPVTLWAQNTMLDTYPGDLGGKIGWTTASKTTYIGWARRNGHTLVVTILHCTPLTEMTIAARLLNWGFAMDGKVKPVGVLVPPLPEHPATHPVVHRPPARPTHQALPRAAKIGGPSVPLLAGLGALVLAVLAGLAIAAATRRRAASSPAGGGPGGGGSPGGGSPGGGSPSEGPAGAQSPHGSSAGEGPAGDSSAGGDPASGSPPDGS